jgi:hypothetical protein
VSDIGVTSANYFVPLRLFNLMQKKNWRIQKQGHNVDVWSMDLVYRILSTTHVNTSEGHPTIWRRKHGFGGSKGHAWQLCKKSHVSP